MDELCGLKEERDNTPTSPNPMHCNVVNTCCGKSANKSKDQCKDESYVVCNCHLAYDKDVGVVWKPCGGDLMRLGHRRGKEGS